jgi:energy-coupling factor transporter transmembrane protein EcfT
VKHLETEQWSRQSGPLHGLDARAKLIAVLIALVFIGTARPWTPRHAGFYAILALLAALLSRLEWSGLARRLALILPSRLPSPFYRGFLPETAPAPPV